MFFLTVKKNAILLAVSMLVGLALLGVGVGVTNSASVYLGRSNRLVPIYNVDTPQQKVALTFDAAWGSDSTERILDTLKENNVKATFFLVGFWVEKYPELVKRIDAEGHEIGTHSNTHPHMPKLSENKMRLELETSSNLIKTATGKDVELFRAPFGDYSDKMLNLADSMGLKTIQWDVDTLDWKDLTATDITMRVMSKAKAGSIVLMHNDGKHTAEALPLIISGLKNKGCEMVKVGDLVYKDNYTVDHAGVQHKND